MTTEFKHVLGFTLWGIAGALLIAEQFISIRMVRTMRRRYPEMKTLSWWHRSKPAKEHMKNDPEIRTMNRVSNILRFAFIPVGIAAAELSGWHFLF